MPDDGKNSQDADIYAGQMLKTLRAASGISQENLAESIELSFQQVQKYEKATNRISVSMLDKICQFFHVEPGVFFRHADSNGYSPLDTAQSLMRDIYALSPQNRRTIIDLVKFFGEK